MSVEQYMNSINMTIEDIVEYCYVHSKSEQKDKFGDYYESIQEEIGEYFWLICDY